MKTLHIMGAGIADTCYELDIPGFEPITWNVSKLEQAAFRGLFGPPVTVDFSKLPPMTENEWSNLNRRKIDRMIKHARAIQSIPDWTNHGRTITRMRLIDIPVIATTYMQSDGQFYSAFVDGNHRMTARRMMGLTGAMHFLVPPELEGNYRVEFQES